MKVQFCLGTIAASLTCLFCARPAAAQSGWFTGYYQNVPIVSHKTELSQGGFSDFNRIRLSSEPAFGRFTLEIAYEQTLTLRQHRTDRTEIGLVPSGGEWLDLQWTIADEEHALWRHRFDRLNLSWRPSDKVELIAGRQTVSWATTLFLTPADPFTPFDPADPFRVFRAGVDAVRTRVYPNALSEIDLVVRPTKNDHTGEELTILGRGLTVIAGWEVSGWVGSLYGDTSGAFATAGSVGPFAIRGEAVVRRLDQETVFRGSIGVDRYVAVAGKDMFLVFEYQHDGLGAASADDYVGLFLTEPFLRGELQVLGRNETAVQVSYQIHPLWSVAAMWLWNLSDNSALLTPSFSYSLTNEASLMGGVFFGFGDEQTSDTRPLPSEYGFAGTTGYASVSVYF